MPKLSIIIPAYNVEQYIARCLESCLRQLRSADDLEIIVVDDGSTDSTSEKIKDFVLKYPNIKYLYQENQGQASARNYGLDNADGKYVWFVDGDDYLTDDGITEILELAISHNLDLIAFNLRIVSEIGDVISEASFNNNKEDKIVLDKKSFYVGLRMPHSPCVALFKREFLLKNDLFFKNGIYFEDFEFTVRAYTTISKAMFVNEIHYNYLQREGSTMKSTSKEKNIKRSADLLKIADVFYEIKVSLPDEPQIESWINSHINFAITQSLAYYSKKSYNFEELRAKPFFPLSINNVHGSFKWKCRLINFSLPLYHFIYKCLKK